jgi:diguanylate cyclase (GGDEF)-like protein
MAPLSQPPRALLDETLRSFQHPHRYARLFAPQMEAAFQQARLPKRIARFQESILLGCFLYNIFLFPDYQCMQPQFALCLWVRLGICTPLAVLFLLAITRAGRALREFIFAFAAIPPTIGVIYLYNYTARMQGCAVAVVVLMMLFAINALRPDFRYACFFTPLLTFGYSIYLAATPLLDKPIAGLYIAIAWAVAGLSLLSCYRLEVDERIAYLLHLRIEEQNATLERVNEELTQISLIDPLTGIPNRRAFNNEFRGVWDLSLCKAQSLAVLMIDLDHFKVINDVHGHEYGDIALCVVAHTMADALRAECDMLARYGGEEFIALLPNQTLESAQNIAQRLCDTVRLAPLPLGKMGAKVQVTISIGVAAVLPTQNTRAADLLRAADVSLYKAKANGRDCIHPALTAS